jgi:hypothetical protein
MRRPWFTTEPVDENFFEIAPVRLSSVFDIELPASDIWADLTSENPLRWCRMLKRISWTSRPPFGVGSTRTARTRGGISVIEELFFRWEEGRRHSFYVTKASLPVFRRLAEDYLIEPTANGLCRFTWTIAYEVRPTARILEPLNQQLFKSMFRDTHRHYERLGGT